MKLKENKKEIKILKTSFDDISSKKLFSECFFERAKNTDKIFKTILKDSLVLKYLIDEKLVAQLFLIESEISINKNIPIYYLYGASTDKNFRGQGIMHCLLEKAKEETIKNERFGIVLKPANEELFDFYESAGFKNIIYCNIFEHSYKTPKNNYKEISAKDYIKIREKLLEKANHIILKDILIDGIANNYKIYSDGNSLAVCEKYTQNKKAFIAEFLGDSDIIDFVLKKLSCETAIVKTIGINNRFSVFWTNKKIEPQQVYHGPAFE